MRSPLRIRTTIPLAPGTTIPYLSTANRVPPYAISMPHIAYHHTLSQYRTPPRASYHHTLAQYRTAPRAWYHHTLSQNPTPPRVSFYRTLCLVPHISCHHTPAQYRTSCTTIPYRNTGHGIAGS
eukprot:75280-Rhodomonas_salina.1